MVKIEKNKIYITRGDTLETSVSIYTESGDEYVPTEFDKIRFALKSDYSDSSPILLKEIPYDTLILRLESEDTKKLAARKKPYVYDIEITMENGNVDTFIDRSPFYVTEEVY